MDSHVKLVPTAASLIAARLDRLPFSRTIWRLVLFISLGGIFELYDIFLSGYIAPGLVRSGLFSSTPTGFFDLNGIGFFVFSNFAGMFVGCLFFGAIADRLGRRSIFITALVWYSIASAVMAFQHTAAGVDLWRFIAGIGVGLEQVTIDTFLPELVPPRGRGKAFAFYQFVEFCIVPVVALLGWLMVPRQWLGVAGWSWVTVIGSAGALIAWQLRRGLPESHAGWRFTDAMERQRESCRNSKRASRAIPVSRCLRRGLPLRPPAAKGRCARSFSLPTESARSSFPSST